MAQLCYMQHVPKCIQKSRVRHQKHAHATAGHVQEDAILQVLQLPLAGVGCQRYIPVHREACTGQAKQSGCQPHMPYTGKHTQGKVNHGCHMLLEQYPAAGEASEMTRLPACCQDPATCQGHLAVNREACMGRAKRACCERSCCYQDFSSTARKSEQSKGISPYSHKLTARS